MAVTFKVLIEERCSDSVLRRTYNSADGWRLLWIFLSPLNLNNNNKTKKSIHSSHFHSFCKVYYHFNCSVLDTKIVHHILITSVSLTNMSMRIRANPSPLLLSTNSLSFIVIVLTFILPLSFRLLPFLISLCLWKHLPPLVFPPTVAKFPTVICRLTSPMVAIVNQEWLKNDIIKVFHSICGSLLVTSVSVW